VEAATATGRELHRANGARSSVWPRQGVTALILVLVMGLLALGLPAAAQTQVEKRVALVIGNGAYPRAPLANPVNDAADLSAALRRLGFEVMERRNRNSEELKRDLIEFQDKLGPGAVGLFYFAGHGVQAGRGLNYLLPVGRDYLRERDAEMYGLEAGTVLRRMEESGAALSVVILDACRDSPLPPEARSSGSRGLARMEAPSGSLIAFATAAGSTADENRGARNGLYTQYLLRAIEAPGLRLEDVFQQVRRDVERASNRRQSPEEISKLTSAFYFRPMTQAATQVATAIPDSELEAWELAKRRDNAGSYEAYLRAYPQGRYVAAARTALEGFKRQTAAQQGMPAPVPTTPVSSCDPSQPWMMEETIDPAVLRQCGTGLLWTRSDNGRNVSWPQAQAYCQSLGDGRWNLPTVRELASLHGSHVQGVSCGSYTCKVFDSFKLSSNWFWSAEQVGPKRAWLAYLHLGDRGSPHVGEGDAGRALCIRRP
jgi:hypothetical protein